MRRTDGTGMIVLLLALLTTPAFAGIPPMAIAGKGGTQGLGGDLTLGLSSNLNARIGLSGLDVSIDYTANDVEYDASVDLFSYSALLDWYPLENSFFISGGIVFPDIEAELDATPTGAVTIGDNNYSYGTVGTLNGKLTNDTDIAPYLGIGWGNALSENKRLGLLLDLGVIFTDTSHVSLSSTGSVSQEDLSKEEADINSDLDDWKIYPVVSLSLYYRF